MQPLLGGRKRSAERQDFTFFMRGFFLQSHHSAILNSSEKMKEKKKKKKKKEEIIFTVRLPVNEPTKLLCVKVKL